MEVSVIFLTIKVGLNVLDLLARTTVRGYHLLSIYGPPGILVHLFESRATWRTEAQVLGKLKVEDAFAFKDSILAESTMIAVAAAIVAQIAITGLSLSNLSQTHWIARGCFVLSLTTSLMAVYYATTQQRMLGRLLHAKQVRRWIRGGNQLQDTARLIPSLEQIVQRLKQKHTHQSRRAMNTEQYRADLQARIETEGGSHLSRPVEAHLEENSHAVRMAEEGSPDAPRYPTTSDRFQTLMDVDFKFYSFVLYYVIGIPITYPCCDPSEFKPNPKDRRTLKKAIISQCFTPSASSVITISAPQMLLSTSLVSLFVGFGTYLGFLWARNLDDIAGSRNSRNVFITYLIALGVSGLVYSISRLFQDDDKCSEGAIMEGYLQEFVRNNPEIVRSWGVDAEFVAGVLTFSIRQARSAQEDTVENGQNLQRRGSRVSEEIELEEREPIVQPPADLSAHHQATSE